MSRLPTQELKKRVKNIHSQIPAPYSPGCFIATVVYGSPNHHKLKVFRKFRDELLLKDKVGRVFIRLYYRISPRVAYRIKEREALKRLILFLVIEPVHQLMKFLFF
jgi:hypothetical protein